MNSEQIRLEALQMAERYYSRFNEDTPPWAVIKLAKKYEQFILTGVIDQDGPAE